MCSRYSICHNLCRYHQSEILMQSLSKLVNAVADDRRGCLCVRSKLACVQLQLESRPTVTCSMCISWNSSFCRVPYVMRRRATNVMDCDAMCELLIVIVYSVVPHLSQMNPKDRKDAKATQGIMREARLRSPSACQRLLSGSGQDTLGACFVQNSALWGQWNV